MKRFFEFAIRNHYGIAFFITLFVAIGLILGGFFVPPIGEISGSVITAVGEIFLWPALGLGAKTLSEGRKASFKAGKAEITLGGDKDEDDSQD